MTLAKSMLAMRQTWQARGLPPLLPLMVVGLLVFCALLAPLLAPHSPIEGSLGKRLIPPLGMEGSSVEHVLGTDRLGRAERGWQGHRLDLRARQPECLQEVPGHVPRPRPRVEDNPDLERDAGQLRRRLSC